MFAHISNVTLFIVLAMAKEPKQTNALKTNKPNSNFFIFPSSLTEKFYPIDSVLLTNPLTKILLFNEY